MAVYTVHEPPLREAMSAPEPERFVFVRDGFSFWALLFGPLWMLRHRMWLVLLGYGGVAALLSLVLRLYAPAAVGPIAWTLFGLLLGFEAGTLRRFTLGRRGFQNIGIVVGDDLELAERRFFDSWISRRSSFGESNPGSQTASPAPTLPMEHPILGLFPDPRTLR